MPGVSKQKNDAFIPGDLRAKLRLPLKIPICTFDAKTGILCARCGAKLQSGQISAADIRASRALVQLAEKGGELNKVTLFRSFEVEGSYLLEVERADVPVFHSKPEMITKLELALKGRVWVVGASGSDRGFLEDLFYPIRVLTVNVVWLPDGSRLTKLIMPWRRSERPPAAFETLRKFARVVKGVELVIETESEPTLRL